MFERARPRGQVPARELREAGALLESVRPAISTGNQLSPVRTGGGTVWLSDDTSEFTAKITAVVDGPSPGIDPKQYGFVEYVQNPTTGNYEEATSARRSDGTKNYALAPPGVTHAVNDFVRVRRHRRDPYLFQIVPGGTAAAAADPWFFAEVTGSGGTPLAYSWAKRVMTGPGVWAAPDPAETGTLNAYRAPSNTPAGGAPPAIPNGQVVAIRPSPTSDGEYELMPWGGLQTASFVVVTDVVMDVVTCTVTRTFSTVAVTGRDLKVTVT